MENKVPINSPMFLGKILYFRSQIKWTIKAVEMIIFLIDMDGAIKWQVLLIHLQKCNIRYTSIGLDKAIRLEV